MQTKKKLANAGVHCKKSTLHKWEGDYWSMACTPTQLFQKMVKAKQRTNKNKE